jgi:sec-independent protein translocase protein TatA
MAYETVIIIAIIIGAVVFGAKKIPELARTFGKAKGEFEKGRIEGDAELRDFKEKKDKKDFGRRDTGN